MRFGQTTRSVTGASSRLRAKPIISVTPSDSLLLQTAVGFQWHQTTRDTIYAVARDAHRQHHW